MPASLVGLDSALREAMNGLFRLDTELRLLGSAESEAAVALAPKGCPDLRAIIGQLGPWRDEVYARVHGIKIDKTAGHSPKLQRAPTMASEPRAYVCPFCTADTHAPCRDRAGRLLQRVHSERSAIARSCGRCGRRAGVPCIDDEGAVLDDWVHKERRSKKPGLRVSLRIFEGRRQVRTLTGDGNDRCFTTYLFACWLFGDHLVAAASDEDSPDHRLAKLVLNVHAEVRRLGAKGMEP